MKIAYVYDAVYPWVKGGAERRIYELSTRMAKRGHEVHCLGIKWWKGDDDLVHDGVHLHGICPPLNLYTNDRRSCAEAGLFALMVLLRLKGRFDIIDCQEFPYIPCFSARIRSALSQSPMVITWHEVWGDYWRSYLGRAGHVGELAELAVAKLSSGNIAVSERTRRDLETINAPSTVVPNGIDLKGISSVKPGLESWDLIYVGRLAMHKNVDLVLKSLCLVRKRVSDIRCLIVGDGPMMGDLKQMSFKLGLDESVEFRGFLSEYKDVISAIKSSRMLVLPSTREGFGMVALEANACGLPVITVDHKQNAAADLIDRGNGFVCKPTAKDMASAILEGLSRGSAMRNACLLKAREYDWEEILNKLETVYVDYSQGTRTGKELRH